MSYQFSLVFRISANMSGLVTLLGYLELDRVLLALAPFVRASFELFFLFWALDIDVLTYIRVAIEDSSLVLFKVED